MQSSVDLQEVFAHRRLQYVPSNSSNKAVSDAFF